MLYTVGHMINDQSTDEILQHTLHLLHLSLSPLQLKDGLDEFYVYTEQQAAVYISGQLYASYEVRFPSPDCGLCAERAGFLYFVPSSVDRPQDIHLSSQN